MYIYKFRLLFDDVEDFVRDYEILSEQTFKDFHDVIIKSIASLDGRELASFHICDGRWEKKKEITLIDMDVDDDSSQEDKNERDTPKAIMSESVLSDFIDDPHQRMIYEYNFLNINTFYIELLKMFESNAAKKYPCCIHAVGELPQTNSNLLDEDLDIDFGDDPDAEGNVDYYDDEDLQSLSENIEF